MGRSDTTTLNVPFAMPQPTAAEIQPGAALPQPAEVKPVLTHCPYCSCKLATVEVKMERCLSCGAQLNPAASVLTREQTSGSYIVRI
jgi:hypothetical protein